MLEENYLDKSNPLCYYKGVNVICILPLILLLNTDASIIARLTYYKTPDPHADFAAKICRDRANACPKSVAIFPSGHVHITCYSEE